MNKFVATLAGTLLFSVAQAGTLERQLVGQWLSQCKQASGSYMQITSRFTADGKYSARSKFYLDPGCTQAMEMEMVSSGNYRLGGQLTAEGGEAAREIDIDVVEMRSGQMQLPGAGQRITQIIAIIDGRMVFGDAPGLQSVTAGERPRKLNKQFYSHKQ
ncbi:hypothetical protein [Microbulbifer yueqingensis]|uniref:APCDD1 domain-containing protein n=1 Tax=Microbulbifer yueqingensis TaxID=658219 RepID=A0A1G8X843_9GAMM|nr:hypothetical protein [Microbulbifer yueqingensis]SDJ86486.1 hypothetical protein SAMN05216212_0993 [Microbulbifer yueqingensis]